MSQSLGEKSYYVHSTSPQSKMDSGVVVKHIEIVLSVFAFQPGYLSEKEAYDKVQKILQTYIAQGRAFPLPFTGFQRQISLALRKNWLERNGTLLRITTSGLEAFCGDCN